MKVAINNRHKGLVLKCNSYKLVNGKLWITLSQRDMYSQYRGGIREMLERYIFNGLEECTIELVKGFVNINEITMSPYSFMDMKGVQRFVK